MNNTYTELVSTAIKTAKSAYSPYSGFNVGAALLAKSGKVYTGCNIESASYSLTNCAERTAFFKAVSEGVMAFSAIAIFGCSPGTAADYCFPCGACRQVIAEFCSHDFEVIVAKSADDFKVYSLGDLLPHSFSKSNLEGC